MKQIVIDVDDSGEIKLKTQGFTGRACMEETRFIKSVLGKEVYTGLVPAFYERTRHIKRYLPLCG